MMKIYSINPMSFDSGPGIRVEVILCDNEEGIELTAKDLVDRIRKFRPYFGPDGGGVTFKGNNIFKYSQYLEETCLICHKAGINTCIETNGIDYSNNNSLLNYVDLIILKIDSLPLYNYNNFSIESMMNTSNLINDINDKNIDVYIKQFIESGVNDTKEYIDVLKKYISMYNISNVELVSNSLDDSVLLELKEKLNEV